MALAMDLSGRCLEEKRNEERLREMCLDKKIEGPGGVLREAFQYLRRAYRKDGRDFLQGYVVIRQG